MNDIDFSKWDEAEFSTFKHHEILDKEVFCRMMEYLYGDDMPPNDRFMVMRRLLSEMHVRYNDACRNLAEAK